MNIYLHVEKRKKGKPRYTAYTALWRCRGKIMDVGGDYRDLKERLDKGPIVIGNHTFMWLRGQ